MSRHAREPEVFCDIHENRGVQGVPGTEEQIYLKDKKRVAILDMCDEDRQLPYAEVMELAASLGAIFEELQPRATRSSDKSNTRRRSRRPKNASCPLCGEPNLQGEAGDVVSQGIKMHVWRSTNHAGYGDAAVKYFDQHGKWPTNDAIAYYQQNAAWPS